MTIKKSQHQNVYSFITIKKLFQKSFITKAYGRLVLSRFPINTGFLDFQGFSRKIAKFAVLDSCLTFFLNK